LFRQAKVKLRTKVALQVKSKGIPLGCINNRHRLQIKTKGRGAQQGQRATGNSC